MTIPKYRRWPRACEYLGKPKITTWWPRVQFEQYCIAPALNVRYFNPNVPDNPTGWQQWGQRLAFCDGLSWNYSEFTFTDAPDYVLYVLFQQVYDAFGVPVFSITGDIIKGGIWKTARGHRLIPMTGEITNPWADGSSFNLYSTEDDPPPLPNQRITVWYSPVRVGLMHET